MASADDIMSSIFFIASCFSIFAMIGISELKDLTMLFANSTSPLFLTNERAI